MTSRETSPCLSGSKNGGAWRPGTCRRCGILRPLRASLGDRTLAWALLMRLLIDERMLYLDAASQVRPLLDRRDPESRLETAAAYNNGNLAAIHQEARKADVGFLVSPCWYLVILRDVRDTQAVIKTLRPASHEAHSIGAIVAAL